MQTRVNLNCTENFKNKFISADHQKLLIVQK